MITFRMWLKVGSSKGKVMGLTDKMSREGRKFPARSDCKGLSDTRSSACPQGFVKQQNSPVDVTRA